MILLPDDPIYTGKADGPLATLKLNWHRLQLRAGKTPPDNPVFILGTGRSGTHWVGHILEPHPELKALIEKPPHFSWVTEMAIDPGARPRLYDGLVERYRLECMAAAPLRVVDKSHPNIWQAEDLAESFPEAQFIGVMRDVFGTVSSMLRHTGVRFWVENWDAYPTPNNFLGITTENRDWYAALSLAGKCAVRWKAHLHRLDELERTLGERMLRLSYTKLQTETDSELKRIAAFLGLSRDIAAPEVRSASLEKWKEHLDEAEVAEIRSVVGDDAGREL